MSSVPAIGLSLYMDYIAAVVVMKLDCMIYSEVFKNHCLKVYPEVYHTHIFDKAII